MDDARDHPWLFLGSMLWLRPLEAADLPRLRSFLRRKDVLRAGNTAARLRTGDPARMTLAAGPGISLVALDPLGAPAGVFHLRGTRDGVVLSFAMPRAEPGVLREAVRLLTLALPSRTPAERLTIPGLSGEPEAVRALVAAGWTEMGAGLCFDLSARRTAEASSHAG